MLSGQHFYDVVEQDLAGVVTNESFLEQPGGFALPRKR